MINGAGGRRRWSVDDKARIIEETLAPGAVVSEVARRHGLTPQQLFGWRREARERSEASDDAGPRFVPAVVELASTPCDVDGSKPRRWRRSSSRSAASRCGSGRGAEATTVRR